MAESNKQGIGLQEKKRKMEAEDSEHQVTSPQDRCRFTTIKKRELVVNEDSTKERRQTLDETARKLTYSNSEGNVSSGSGPVPCKRPRLENESLETTQDHPRSHSAGSTNLPTNTRRDGRWDMDQETKKQIDMPDRSRLSSSRFGQRRPPLTKLIASILDRYPDGGQILKELIQNADDAGATEVKFLYDDKTYGTQSLFTQELDKFQGPALYCYNNAMFNEADWHGIQNLMCSNKKDDPLKVGRFGIGFNSVYLITDLPSIVSGPNVAFLDPHERFFGRGESGKQFSIDFGLLQPELFDQFAPFNGIFGCDLSSGMPYDHTLFRFPLRKTPESELSKTVYNESMINILFKSLRQEASIILLYLKCVQSISIFRRSNDDLKRVFKVEISDDTRKQVIMERENLLRAAIQTTSVVESKYVIGVNITTDKEIVARKWLVVNRIGSTNNERITHLRNKLHLLPWIGLALPVDERIPPIKDGRIFCFLPLPPDVDCSSGLPVHIHGYFGLNDNRRGLTWPGMECQNNETAEWNTLLVEKVASSAYCKILEALITNQPSTGLSEDKRCHLIYSTMPVLKDVRGHWECILAPLFQEMIHQPVFYAQTTSGNSWVTLRDGVLDLLHQSETSQETRKIILKVLQGVYAVITDLPFHVLDVIQKYFPSPRIISPDIVRRVLKRSEIGVTEISREDKLNLLSYVLSDGKTTDITDIPLLPLANKSFIQFRGKHVHLSAPQASVLVPSENCTRELLPNMSDRFLDENLEENIKSKLSSIAATETNVFHSTQLVRLTTQIVVDNMRSSLPSTWFKCNNDKVLWQPGISDHPPESWLEASWKWINESFPTSLTQFEGIPLLPVDSQLGILSSSSKFIFSSEAIGTNLPTQVCDLLSACGCTVLTNLPSYIRCHKDINTYVAPPTPSGVLRVLSRVSMTNLVTQATRILTSEKLSIFREFISRVPNQISNSERSLLLQLPLFETLHGTVTAALQLKAVPANINLPTDFQLLKDRVLIMSTDFNVEKLLSVLNVPMLLPADMLIGYVFPDILAGRYDDGQIDVLMPWILEQIGSLKSQNDRFLNELKNVAFVSTDSGMKKRPAELYDPNDAVLCDILDGKKDVFPSGFYATSELIATLKCLGLKTKETLTVSDLFRFAQMVASDVLSSPLVVRKVNALFKILNDNPSYLNNCSSRSTLKEDLTKLKWIPCATIPPSTYPNFVQWYSKPALLLPSEVRISSKALLIGSSMPTIDININSELEQAFGLARDPPLFQVIQQLQAAIASWKSQQEADLSAIEVAKFQEMLIQIYCHLSRNPANVISSAIATASLVEWIWHGKGFCSPQNVALSRDFTFDLRPRLFIISKEFRSNSTLVNFFLRHGVKKMFSGEDILDVLDSIREKHANPTQPTLTEVTQDLAICGAILQWVVKDGNVLPEHLQEKVFVPVQSPNDVLVLATCKKCTYCDRDWLRKGGSELDIPGDYQVIHSSVSVEIARLLGVPALSTCLLSAETMGFEQTGPNESITNRINTILNEYPEGNGIFKELVQNADDAGATVVRFIVDWRNGPTEKLLSPNMAACQGPALWAYNNEEFSDNDFVNINKLAGATKVKEVGKIGRFGLGFNAVYHLTDVPSFVSRQYFVLFDPNVNHIDNHISNKLRPGIRIDLASNPRPLSAFEDQFQPYHGVFGCNTQMTDGMKFNFNGTLFRFPFRTSREAIKSEICQSVYNKDKVKQIVSSLKECSSLLLLFTQHVTQVELYEIEDDFEVCDMKLLLSISKEPAEIKRSSYLSSSRCPFLEDCSKWWEHKLANSTGPPVTPSRCEIFEVIMKEMQSKLLCSQSNLETHETWLVTSCGGTGSSVSLAITKEGRSRGLLPCGGAALRLDSKLSVGSSLKSCSKVDAVEGEIFCFLPLSISTGLPVHVNGYFAITSNRRGIWERTTSHQDQQMEVQWNESLLQDALCTAYLLLLNDVKTIQAQDYDFYLLWPVYDKLQSATWEKLVESVYDSMVSNSLPLFYSDGKWLSINEGYILDVELSKIPEVRDSLKRLNKNVFAIPSQVVSSLIKAGQKQAVDQSTLDLKTFLEKLFLPNVYAIDRNIRDPIVCYILDSILSGRNEFLTMLDAYPCITCSQDGQHLAKPSRLISPNGAVACLFSAEDNRFPVGDCFQTKNRLYALELLGMVKDQISWSEICDRATSVKILAKINKDKAVERTRNLIKYLNENIGKLTAPDSCTVSALQATEFLPFISTCPDGYELAWEGSKFNKEQLFSPKSAFLSSEKNLVGSSCVIVDDSEDTGCGELGREVKKLLGFLTRLPTVEQVIRQLDAAICETNVAFLKRKSLESVCKRVYKFFDDFVAKVDHQETRFSEGTTSYNLKKDPLPGELLKQLSQRPWLLIEGHFVSTKQVAFRWNGNGAPYLYGLPFEYRDKYDELLKMVRVKKTFSSMDFIDALKSLKKAKKDNPLNDEERKLAVCFATELEGRTLEGSHVGHIPLPDGNNVLCLSGELTINLTFWLKDRGDARYVHQDIPPQLALVLGAKSLHNRRLKKYSNTFGTPFGQHEKLTDRLKNILKSYPCDSGILKELVQNADDAGASEIHFIYDTRKLAHDKVVQRHAEEVQGPALCVYNNRPFTREDLEGIQKLGIGSKTDDVEKTGQYGIGFNAVYHLTDCPSFLSNEDTLCFLDPHCRYAPDARPDCPGELFQPIDEAFKEDFKDVLLGYLGEHFKLKGATMFRLPLRTLQRSEESLISCKCPENDVIEELLEKFKAESKKMLLFLNYVKNISLSEVDKNGKLKHVYGIGVDLETKNEEKRRELSHIVKRNKHLHTRDIAWNGITYPLTVSDSANVVETWLVHQCCGTSSHATKDSILDGRNYGLFPRGGIAAQLNPLRSISEYQQEHVAYCFLPLPVYTGLPVHVNGHFALDSSRRNLWHDTDQNSPLTKWNNFMKMSVLAPGYATLILEARQYISFSQEMGAARLLWYHQLFPNPSKDSSWNVLAREVYRFLGSNKLEVLPVVVADDIPVVTRAQRGSNESSKDVIHRIRSWLSVEDAYFLERESQTKLDEDRLFRLLLRVHFPVLLFSPTFVYNWFKQAEITCHVVTPMSVINFLKCFAVPNSKCRVGNLPMLLEETNIMERLDLKVLIDYCKMEKRFPTLLEGLPLLLTADGQLRIFDANYPVFRSKFSDLFPEKANLFVHPDLVYSLPDIGNLPVKQVMQQFTVISLNQLLPSIFPASMKDSCDHVPWEFPPNGPLSRKWFQRLWDFLEEYTTATKFHCSVVSLSVLGAWPILPTTSDKLVTINNGKTVLDATHRSTATTQGKRIRDILLQLHCPTLNTEITVKKRTNPRQSLPPSMPGEFLSMLGSASITQPTDHGSHVTDLLVAQPHNVRDVLQVLDFMRRTGSLNTSTLTSDDLVTVLKFIQDDLINLRPVDASTIKKLPFYVGINDTHFSLSEYNDYAVIPRGGVPISEIGELQHYTGCLFLHPDAASFLHSLYRWLGVGVELSLYEFYIKYIIPQFDLFKRESQIEYLTHIKNDVLPFLHTIDGNQLVALLVNCLCIPDEDGILHYAREFHDPRNKVFQMMLKDNSKHFPPFPFQSSEWLDFLSKIGMKTMVEAWQFLTFCGEVASDACRSTDRTITVEKSKLLVKYLFNNAHLRNEQFLRSVSRIKFVASEKVEPSLLSLHKQFQCDTAGDEPPFVQFLDAVPWKYHVRTWTSTQLLPRWVQPCKQLFPLLGVQEVPSVESMVTHLQNLSCILAEICKRSEELPQPTLLKEVMESIYVGLNEKIECKENEDTLDCCRECRNIGERLQNIPCVLVEDGKAMVTGNKLSFSPLVSCACTFIPFLYSVPRKYFAYYHLLKRLGATEQFTSFQFASVLKAIKEQCQDSKMNPNLFDKAKAATRELFQSLLVEVSNGNKTKICDLKELFLSSEKEILVKSSDLVRKIAPSFRNALASRPSFDVLLPLEKCDLPREKEEEYFNALAPHLRPKLMESLFKEELDSKCLEDRCSLCKEDALCEFVKRYIMILKSPEFQLGIIRLLKHKKNSSEITQEEQDRLSVFGTDKLEIICMRNINVHLVDTKTEEPLENSSFGRPCYVVERSSSWKLYIKHGTGKTQATLLSHYINEISRWLFNADSLRFISTMLLCESPSEIPGALDELDISEDFSGEELKIGREVPVVFHFHLQQNPMFIFHEGEIIAYGVEINDTENIGDGLNENEGFTGMKYVLGKVISRTGNTETDGSYDFKTQYLIDLGSEHKTVSVIDLYKFVQNDAAENQITDIIPCAGRATSLPSGLDETKQEIREALNKGWRLPRGLRRKVIRRLYLRWHPDKNPGNVEYAKEMFEYLLSEVKRMEAEESEIDDSCGFTSLFTGWSRQARRERETYRNFREHFGGSTRSASGYTSPNVNNANRWLKQAQSDLEAATLLISSSQSFDALVCFLSHQVVEKSLKATLYAKCGLSNDQLHTHDVYSLANHVSRLESSPATITKMAVVVSDYYLSTRYPNRQPGSIVPADAFSKEQSTRALENASTLLNAIKTFILA